VCVCMYMCRIKTLIIHYIVCRSVGFLLGIFILFVELRFNK